MSEENTPREPIQQIMRRWWLPLLVMLVGGFGGFLFHLNQPPLYESQAVFTFSFDYARLGKLSDAEEDQAMGAAGAVLNSTDMVNALLSQAQAQDWVPQGFDFAHQIAAERKSYRWILRVRNPDPQNARQIASLWSDLSLAALNDAREHSELANVLLHQLNGLESCLEHMAVTEPAAAQCAWPGQADLQRELGALASQVQTERTASLGLLPGLGFNLSQTAQVPGLPVVNDRNTLVLAGGLLGFIIGAGIAFSALPDRLDIKGSHADPSHPRR